MLRLSRNQLLIRAVVAGCIVCAVLAILNPRLEHKFAFIVCGGLSGYITMSLIAEIFQLPWTDRK